MLIMLGCGSIESMNRFGMDLVGEGRGSDSECLAGFECFLNIGWSNERIISSRKSGCYFGVEEVLKMMEIELGSGWIAHQQCKDSKVDKFLALLHLKNLHAI
ncbi:protein CHROMOSOME TRANSMISSION FIDELITY [Trifolium repens]|nr:protein CHROMOSOME TRANSMISSION FIDELITY [Trifolium repens]